MIQQLSKAARRRTVTASDDEEQAEPKPRSLDRSHPRSSLGRLSRPSRPSKPGTRTFLILDRQVWVHSIS